MGTFCAAFKCNNSGKTNMRDSRDLCHTPNMAAYKMIRLKFELAFKSSINK